MIAFFGTLSRFDRSRVLEKHRIVLVGLPANETVEVIEAKPLGPTVKGTGHAAFPIGRVVVLAKPRCAVTVVFQDRTDRRCTSWDHVVVAGEARRPFREEPRPNIVMVATCNQRRARRTTNGGRVKTGVAKPAGCEVVEMRRRDRPAER